MGKQSITLKNCIGSPLIWGKGKHIIPVKPGRNLSIIIEVAARNFRLKSMGYDAAQELIQRTIGR